jgi:hypothetical protein
MVKANRALYNRQTMIPVSSFQFATLQTCVRVPQLHHDRSPKPTAQIMKRTELRMRFSLGLRPQQQWRTKDMPKKRQVRREPVVSCVGVGQRSLVGVPKRRSTYEDEGPWDVPVIVLEMVLFAISTATFKWRRPDTL